MEELIRDQSMFVQPNGSQSEPTGVSLQTRVVDLETEVTKLREQLVKAKAINDTMWETIVQKVIVGGTREKSEEGEKVAMDTDESEGGRRRKKTRT